jgi:membrane-bound ClpP family serine protease
MAEWTTVISLIVIGLILLIVEIIFIPGTTVIGLIGFAIMVVGVGLSFKYFGPETGWTTMGGAAVLSGVLIYLSFKSNLWGRFALRSSIKSKVNEGELDHLSPGQEGITVSALRPVGKAELFNKLFEVKTLGEYVDSGTKIRIIKVLSNQIIVEPIN